MESELDAKRRTFLWACGWTLNVHTKNWETPKGTERHCLPLDHAVREQFRRNEEAMLDMAAGHAWDWAARYEELRNAHDELLAMTLTIIDRARAVETIIRGGH